MRIINIFGSYDSGCLQEYTISARYSATPFTTICGGMSGMVVNRSAV